MGHFHPDVMTSALGSEGQAVGESDRSRRGSEGGLEDQAVPEIASDRLEVSDGADRPVTGPRVQQPAEHRRGVEARGAEPVDRPVAPHQGGRQTA